MSKPLQATLNAVLMAFLHSWIAVPSAQAVGRTFRCRDVFGPYTPAGDVRDWSSLPGLLLGFERAGFYKSGPPKLVAYHPESAVPSYSAGAEFVIFNFENLADDVQEAMRIDADEINDHVSLLLAWMSDVYFQQRMSPAKMRTLTVFSDFFNLLYDVRPSYHSIARAIAMGTIHTDEGNGSLQEKIYWAARLQIMSTAGHQLLKWWELVNDPMKKEGEYVAKAVSYTARMIDRGYTIEQAWWALRAVIIAGRL